MPYLFDLCEAEEPGLASLRDDAEALSPFAVEIRYPGEVMEVPLQEAEDALATAQAVWDTVLGLLPPVLYPLFEQEDAATDDE